MSFGSFGSGGSSFNTSTSLFGSSSTPSTNLFGQPSNPSPLASTTTQQPTGSLFSNTFGGFGSTNQPQQQQQIASTGTQIKFNPPQGQDSVNKNGSSTTINTMHQCITAMKEYEGKSLEELRCEDYQANRRFPTSTSQFGSGGASGIFSTGGTTSGFGGSSATSTSSSLFGSSTTPKPSLFGSSSTTTTQPQTSLFGQSTANQPNRSFFGASTTPTPTASPFGGFGSQTQQPAAAGFGSTQGQTSSLFGGLGGQQQQQTSGGLFGSSTTTTPSSGGIFGAQQSKPLFSGFGQTAAPSTTTAAQPFSFASQQTTTTTTPTGSIFGQASTQSPLSAAKPFGQTSFGGFGSGSTTTTPAATGGFGATTTTSSGGVGLFGSPAASTQPKPFGSLGGATSTSTGFGGFGSPSTTSTTTAGGGIFGGFGSTSQQQTATTASPFGSTLGGGTTATQSPFGQTSTTTGGGLFGSTQPSTGSTLTGSTSGFGFGQQTSSNTGGFGSTSTSGFGSTTSTQPLGLGLGATSTGTSTLGGTTGLFGSTPASTQQNQFTLGGGGLGGSTTSALGGGLGSTTGSTGGFGSFGLPSSTSVSSGLGGLGSAGSVGLNLQQQQQQQQFQLQQQQQQLQQQQLTPLLQQQLSNSPYGTGSLLKSTIQDLNKKEDIFKPVSPIAQRPYITEATSPAKVTSSLTSSVQGAELKSVGGLSQTIRITPKALTTISLNKPKNDLFEGLEDEEVPCFYPRKNIKKLLFKPQQHAQNESRRSSTTSSINGENINLGGRKSTVFPDDSYKYNITAGQLTTDSTNVSDDGAGGGADNQSEISNLNQHPANITLERPGYFTIPSMQELGGMINEKGDCLVENFAIGRVDYGCITFPGITNLTNLNLDEIVHIRRKEVHVYPDDTKKPQVGQGLNKPAEITLHRIWPTDKQTKTPITDPNRIIMMGYNKKIEKATIEMDAQFVDYDPATGSWTFKVKHFSKYGLNDSDDEDEDDKFINNKNNLNKLANLQQTTAKLTADNLCSKESDKQEKEMINKQLKLIEERRKELMQQKNINKPITNLNSITNQQWDVINEYLPQVQTVSQKVIDHSNIHLELSSSESHDEDIDHNLDNKKPLRKQLELDNDVETDDNEFLDENKENQNGTIVDLYPSLKGFQSKSSGAKNLNIKKSGTTDKLYPSLNNLNINETYNVKFMDDGKNQQFSIEIDSKENIRLMGDYNNMEDNQQQQKIDELPFVTSMAAGSYLKNGNRRLLDTFFGSNDDRDNDDFGMADDDVVPKLGSFNQIIPSKPIGLFKRGLGGSQDADVNLLSTSQRGDQFHGQSKVSRKNVISGLSITDIQQKIGAPLLKPRLWNRFLIQKTSKLVMPSSKKTIEEIQEDLNAVSATATKSKSNQLETVQSYIKLNDSITNNLHWCLADSSLFNSCRFRINWSLYPTACTYTQLGQVPKNSTFLNTVQIVTPILISNGSTSFASLDPTNAKLKVLRDNCETYLKIQLELTEFLTSKSSQQKYVLNSEKNKLPYLKPKVGNELIQRFCDCTLEIRNNIGDHPDADNVEHLKAVWTLCQNLWGDIPDGYKSNPNELNMGNHELEQIRKRLLSEWLTDMSAHRIEKECKINKFNKNKENYLNSIFSYLTGNRILDACNVAIENNDFRLALLISQSSGGNDTVRTMVKKQLKEWFTCSSDKYMNIDRLKFYVLISGLLTYDLSYTKSQFINVCENLDWKRQFALHLWFNCLPINSINDALNSYEKSVSENISNKPVPPYIEDSVSTTSLSEMDSSSTFKPMQTQSKNISNIQSSFSIQQKQHTNILYDTCYHLMKLYCNNHHQIEEIIAPLNHSSNQLDFRLSWHLAMALVALQFNNVSKACLESLHDSYVMQLQSFGLWHWSIFIIMHIEDEKRREKYVRLYLSKNVSGSSELDDKEQFLIEKLNVPAEWIYEYKAMRAKYEGKHENQFKLLLKAHKWNDAHCILVDILAPDFFMKENFKTLNQYLNTLSKEHQSINKWNLGGLIYFDFIKLNQKADILFKFEDLEPNAQKYIDEETVKETHDQLINLSNRLKEFDSRSPKKLFCLLAISKLLLKYFNVFIEMNNTENNEQEDFNFNDDEEETDNSNQKVFTKSLVDRAFEMTNSIPDQDILGTMQLKKSKFTHDLILSSRRKVQS